MRGVGVGREWGEKAVELGGRGGRMWQGGGKEGREDREMRQEMWLKGDRKSHESEEGGDSGLSNRGGGSGASGRRRGAPAPSKEPRRRGWGRLLQRGGKDELERPWKAGDRVLGGRRRSG